MSYGFGGGHKIREMSFREVLYRYRALGLNPWFTSTRDLPS